MKGLARVVAAVLAATVLQSCCAVCCEEVKEGAAVDEKLGWRLSMQAYTFHRDTFFEAVDKTAALGLKYIEMFPGQRVSEDDGASTNFDMSAETRRKVKEKLRDAGLELVNYGVVGAGDEAGWRSLFEFAKDMGIETIVSEPRQEHMDLIEKLCEEFKINVAIHNHPRPTHYWNPDTVLKAVEGRSKRIGACADSGHWMRSGLNPIECLKKLEGRIVSLHFKDLNESGPEAHDVPWGTGAGDANGMLAEVKRQGVKGVFSIEYEHNWGKSLPEIRKCIEYFKRTSAALAEGG
jgi:sugar phosphate isomerase/epimerase